MSYAGMICTCCGGETDGNGDCPSYCTADPCDCGSENSGRTGTSLCGDYCGCMTTNGEGTVGTVLDYREDVFGNFRDTIRPCGACSSIAQRIVEFFCGPIEYSRWNGWYKVTPSEPDPELLRIINEEDS